MNDLDYKRKRLRYLQLKAKAAPAETTRVDMPPVQPVAGTPEPDPAPEVPAQKPQGPGVIERLGAGTVRRAENVWKPTGAGEAVKRLIPGDSPVEGVISEVAAAPERIFRAGAIPIGATADIAGEGLMGVLKLLNKATGKAPEKALKAGAEAAMKNPSLVELLKTVGIAWEDLSEAEKANWGAAIDWSELLGSEMVRRGVQGPVKVAVKQVTTPPVRAPRAAVPLDAPVTPGAVIPPATPSAILDQALAPLKNQSGAVVIPDIDDPAEELVELGLKTSKQIKADLPKVPPHPKQISPAEAVLLATPKDPKVTPFTVYAEDALLAQQNRFTGAVSPMDKAATKATAALREVSEIKGRAGKALSEFLDEADNYGIETSYFVDTRPIKAQLQQEIGQKLGARLTDTGELVGLAGREVRDPGAAPLVRQINGIINNLSDESTIRQIDDARKSIDNVIQRGKASQVKQIFTPDETIGEAMRGELQRSIDNWVTEYMGAEKQEMYRGLRRDYANIRKIEERLNRQLGEIVDPQTGQPRMGASLLKSAIMSNSDRGSKALFRAIKDLTGYDLMTEAGYAAVAMDAVGDPRINDLLASVGTLANVAASLIPGGRLIGAGAKAVGGLLQRKGGKPDPGRIYKLVDYYNEKQVQSARSLKDLMGGILSNQRGSVGGGISSPEALAKQAGVEYKGQWDIPGRSGPHEFFDPQTGGNYTLDDLAQLIDRVREKRGAFGLNEAGQIGAYHGSPYRFDKFGRLDDVVGTGEGARAFGYGLYFSNKKDVAKHYADNFKDITQHAPVNDAEEYIVKKVEFAKNELGGAIPHKETDLMEWLKQDYDPLEGGYLNRETGEYLPKDEVDKAIKNVYESTPGYTYSVTLHKGKTPDQYDYIKWDEPVSQKIDKKLFDYAVKTNDRELIDIATAPNGKELYERLIDREGSDKAASEFLLRAGIDGIDYPAGSLSGVADSKARNYVVFDPEAVTIDNFEQGSSVLPMLGLTGAVGAGGLTLGKLLENMAKPKE